MSQAENLLPAELLSHASLRGKEYAWPIADIPAVIEAARAANLANLGGQLQFRLPNGDICECYWVEVDAFEMVGSGLSWDQVVERSAVVTLEDFEQILQDVDLIAEGQNSFPEYSTEELQDAVCFVWYLRRCPVN